MGKIEELLKDKYKLRIPPTVYYDLLADVQEAEEEQQPILDKIRAEIAELSHYYPMGHDYQIAITRCIAVIDKYKAESEG